jgi:Protein of unknown function (DUF1091)
LQQGLLIADDFRYWTDEKLVNASFSVVTGPDNRSILYSQEIVYLHEAKNKQQRITLSMPVNDNDREYNKVIFSTTMDSCKQFQGVRSNFIMKLFMENFNMTGFGCPFKTNVNYKITNLTCTENYVPPLPGVKYKLEANCFGLLDEKKKWKALYRIAVYGQFKK